MDALLEEFKQRNQIYHKSDDELFKKLLKQSIRKITELCGDFDYEEEDSPGRELVLERARYARNEALEYFEENFGTEIRAFSFENADWSDLDGD